MNIMDCSSDESSSMSRAQLRKIKKPIIERRRRERINDSLGQLKALLLDAMDRDEAEHSKMEKADILEMAVNHLKTVRTRSRPLARMGGDLVDYRAGFNECAREVSQYLHGVQGMDSTVKDNLICHLSSSCTPGAASSPVGLMTSPVGPMSSLSNMMTSPISMVTSPHAGAAFASSVMSTPAWALPGAAGMGYSRVVGDNEHRSPSVLSTSPDSAISCGSRTPSPCNPSFTEASPPSIMHCSTSIMATPLYRHRVVAPSPVDLSKRCSPITVKCEQSPNHVSVGSEQHVPVLALATSSSTNSHNNRSSGKSKPTHAQNTSSSSSSSDSKANSWRPW